MIRSAASLRLVAARVFRALAPLLALVLFVPAAPAGAAPDEMRACWVSRFEWPSSNQATAQSRIRAIMEGLASHNFNAVLFQVRGQCDTHYPNPYEPWSDTYGWTDPGWDPLAYAIEQAHANGLEFHAYINTHTIAAPQPPANTTPQHIFNIHGPGGDDAWLIHDENGAPVDKTDAYWWMSPGVPEASAWTRQAVMYVVENYDVDGVHFDRIRTPASTYSHDPISEARFAGDGNPDGGDWGDFMRSQITRDLRKIYGAIARVKPWVKVSSAPFGIIRKQPGGYQGTGTQAYFSWYQDAWKWLEVGAMDNIFPQIYWEIGSEHPYEVLLADHMNNRHGRHIYPGSITSRDEIAQLYESRNQNAMGQTVFSWGSLNIDAYTASGGPYTEPADPPAMPWKSSPTDAIVVGTVTDSDARPVVDARINISGDAYNYLSAFDGYYAILKIPPGSHNVSGFKQDVGSDAQSIVLGAGDVVELNLRLTTGSVESSYYFTY